MDPIRCSNCCALGYHQRTNGLCPKCVDKHSHNAKLRSVTSVTAGNENDGDPLLIVTVPCACGCRKTVKLKPHYASGACKMRAFRKRKSKMGPMSESIAGTGDGAVTPTLNGDPSS